MSTAIIFKRIAEMFSPMFILCRIKKKEKETIVLKNAFQPKTSTLKEKYGLCSYERVQNSIYF